MKLSPSIPSNKPILNPQRWKRLLKLAKSLIVPGVLLFVFCLLLDQNPWTDFKAIEAYRLPFHFLLGIADGHLNPYLTILQDQYHHGEAAHKIVMGRAVSISYSEIHPILNTLYALLFLLLALAWLCFLPLLWGGIFKLFLKLFCGRRAFAVLVLLSLIMGLGLASAALKKDALQTLTQEKRIIYPYYPDRPNPYD